MKRNKYPNNAAIKKLINIFDNCPDSINFFDAINTVFKTIEVAEKVIKSMKKRYPEHANKIHKTFKYLKPTNKIFHDNKTLYRHHCKELIKRHIKNKNMDYLTDAEVLLVLKETSLKAPLNTQAAGAYIKLFNRIVPKHNKQPELPEPYKGAYKEIINQIKRNKTDRLTYTKEN